jgi:hypothetical protein
VWCFHVSRKCGGVVLYVSRKCGRVVFSRLQKMWACCIFTFPENVGVLYFDVSLKQQKVFDVPLKYPSSTRCFLVGERIQCVIIEQSYYVTDIPRTCVHWIYLLT